MAIARLIRALAIAVAVVIAAGIVLFVVSANPHNVIVSDIHDAANWLVGPFHHVFSVKDSKLELGLNWGLAALVYLAVGSLLAGLLARTSARSSYGRVGTTA